MDDTNTEKENLEVTPEEQKAELEAMTEVGDDDLKTKIAEDMGIDPDTESELLDKLVTKEKDHRSKLSGAIKQKIKYREASQKKPSTEKKPAGDDPADKGDSEDKADDFDAKFEARMAERDLKDLDLPEAIQTEVKKVAEVQGISVREAAKDPYIVSRMEQHVKDERVKNSSPDRKNKGVTTSDFDPSKPLDMADFDFDTKEGRDAWAEAKKRKAEHRKKS